MLKVIIVGASGYTGAELALIIARHPRLILSGLYVSANSIDANKKMSTLHGKLAGVVEMEVKPLINIKSTASECDIVFLATAHEVSHELAPEFVAHGCQVFDLSGAYRVSAEHFYPEFYGFEHQHQALLSRAAYGLAEWNEREIKAADLIAVAGCYPTASQLAIKPLLEMNMLDCSQWPVINAVSGVSGAGRKPGMVNSFCEVSLQAYGLFNHRHQPEIASHLGCDVIFTPHLGNFKRGILATITMKLVSGVTEEEVGHAFEKAYHSKAAVRLKYQQIPKIQDVEFTPYCDIGWKIQGEHVIVVSAIDNLLKGASSHAVQCFNIRNGFEPLTALI